MRSAALDQVAKIDRTVASEAECATLPYVGLEHIEKETGRFAREFDGKPETLLATKFRFTPKHVLYGKLRPYLNKVALPPFDGVCTTEILPILPDENELDRTYLWAFLLTPGFVEWASANISGANLPRLSPALLAKRRIPLPPLPEQKRIAAILARADRLRRLRRYALDLGDSYLRSVFLEMFKDCLEGRYPTTPLGKLVTITGGGTPSRDVARYYEGTIPWLTSKDMRADYIVDTQEHITEEAIRNSATKLVPAGSILIVVKSKILMHRLPIAICKRALCHGQDIKSIQCSGKVEPVFIVHILKHNEPRILAQARGANTEGLTLPMLESVAVPDVSLMRQQQFARIVHGFERLRAQQREAQRQAEHLFQTLLHRAFTGQL